MENGKMSEQNKFESLPQQYFEETQKTIHKMYQDEIEGLKQKLSECKNALLVAETQRNDFKELLVDMLKSHGLKTEERHSDEE